MDVHIIFAKISWYILIVIMMMRPLAQVSSSGTLMRLLPYRKYLGILCGFAAIFHVVIFLVTSGIFSIYFFEEQFWTLSNLFGWGNIAFLCLLIPFVTSNRWSQRHLRTRWKKVQLFAYPAFVATAIHVAFATGAYVASLLPLVIWMILWVLAAYRKRRIKT